MRVGGRETAETIRRRDEMVEYQLRRRGILDQRVLDAMGRVPREIFVPEHLAELAYEDGPLSIGHGQTISQPYIVARMLEAAGIEFGDRILDVGTGSGYAAAVASLLASETFTIERDAELAWTAQTHLAERNYAVTAMIGDGTLGWPEHAPFDVILVAACAPAVPASLKAQLADGGRMIIPVGPEALAQDLLRVSRTGREFHEEVVTLVNFVPLIGAEGRKEYPFEISRRSGRSLAR